jgi:hypothetical protein
MVSAVQRAVDIMIGSADAAVGWRVVQKEARRLSSSGFWGAEALL